MASAVKDGESTAQLLLVLVMPKGDAYSKMERLLHSVAFGVTWDILYRDMCSIISLILCHNSRKYLHPSTLPAM